MKPALCLMLVVLSWGAACAALRPHDIAWIATLPGVRQAAATDTSTRLLHTYRVTSPEVLPRLLQELERRGWRVRSRVGMSTERAAVVAVHGTLTMSVSMAPGRVMSVTVTETTAPRQP